MNKTALQMIKTVEEYRTNALSLSRLIKIVDKLKEDDIKNLFRLNDTICDDEIK